jgi:hypothetical protein
MPVEALLMLAEAPSARRGELEFRERLLKAGETPLDTEEETELMVSTSAKQTVKFKRDATKNNYQSSTFRARLVMLLLFSFGKT